MSSNTEDLELNSSKPDNSQPSVSESLNASFEDINIPTKELEKDELLNLDIQWPNPSPPQNKTPKNSLSMNLAPWNNINEDLSESGYRNWNTDNNFDEIFDNINYLLSYQANTIKNDKEVLKQSISNFISIQAEEVQQWEREKAKYQKNTKIIKKMQVKQDSLVKWIVGNNAIVTSAQTLSKYKASLWYTKIFCSTKHSIGNDKKKNYIDNPIIIDRNPTVFMKVISYLRNDKAPYIADQALKKKFLDELEYWNIPLESPVPQMNFQFDKELYSSTLVIDSNWKVAKKKTSQDGILFVKPCWGSVSCYIEFHVIIKKQSKNTAMLSIGWIDKNRFINNNLCFKLWKDIPHSYYWDIWDAKIKCVSISSWTVQKNYGCTCDKNDAIIGMKYDADNKSVSFYKNGINCGVAFKNIKDNLSISLNICFEEGYVEILKTATEPDKVFL